MSKMISYEPFGHLQHKLWLNERSGVKLVVWFPTTKSQESTQSQCMQVECDTPLESSQRELQLWFRPYPIRAWGEKLWMPKVPKVQIGTISGLHFGSPRKNSHLDASAAKSCRKYYMGEGGGFPRVRAVVSQVSPRSPVACPNTENVQNEF
jgi:hypothetical protein